MALYVRLQTSFWTHRKTLRLRASIGDDALWIPPRLWSYAAMNQPDGDFSNYSATELGMLLGYAKGGQALLEALQQASFLDGMKIHGWEEHNGYHDVFAKRAKTAAKERWKIERAKKRELLKKEMNREEKTRQEPSIASSIACEFDEFWKAYPRKIGKGTAETAWKKHGCKDLLPQILTAVRQCKISSDWSRDGGQYIPYPATWLNRKGWDDEMLPFHTNVDSQRDPSHHIPSLSEQQQ